MIFLSVCLLMMACSTKSYVIVQVADAQLGFTSAIKGQEPGAVYVNDLTYEADYLRKAVEKINEVKPDAVVFTGDQVNLFDNAEQWDLFAEIISGIDASVKLLHVPGNHDVIISEGSVDSEPFTSRYGEDRFVYKEKGVALVGVNTNVIKYNDPSESDQYEWLSEVLKKERHSDVTLIFGHHPFFLADINEEDGYFQLQNAKRGRYFTLFKEMDVDAVYAGHLHNSSEGAYEGIPMKTTTSAAYQIGKLKPSIRVITVQEGEISDDMLLL